jgi:hypothetical protein
MKRLHTAGTLASLPTLAVALAVAMGAALSSCVGQGTTACIGPCSCPSEDVFALLPPEGGTAPAGASVSEYMERRCGTLDCHGSVARPMRLYGQFGLREPSGADISGGKATTLLELQDNYSAVCSLQPEETQQAVEVPPSAESLIVVQKARGNEAHKDGQIFTLGSPGDNCLTGWLRGDEPATVAAACQQAIDGL